MSTNSLFADVEVSDLERLAAFRHFRSQWIQMVSGEDVHAIHYQLTSLLSVDIEFRTIDHSRSLSKGLPGRQCGIVHDFIDKGFIAHQALAIRRLTEPFDGAKSKAVISIPRILTEIENHKDLITRENFVCVDLGKYEDPHDRRVELRHRTFDFLSDVSANSRQPNDIISEEMFTKCRSRFKSSEVFRTYANKFLAHAADPLTRKGTEEFRISLLDDVYQDLIWLTNLISAKILHSASHSFLVSYLYDALEGIDVPICPPNKIGDLRAFWKTRYSELELLERSTRYVTRADTF